MDFTLILRGFRIFGKWGLVEGNDSVGLGLKIYNLVPLPVISLVPKPPLCEQSASCCGLHSSEQALLATIPLCLDCESHQDRGKSSATRQGNSKCRVVENRCYHEQIPQPWQLVTVVTVN